jgi:hypothetical protein
LSVSLVFATQESYPGGVAKPRSIKCFTAFAVACKLATHIGLYFLGDNPAEFDNHSQKCIVGMGLLSAAFKIAECIMICHAVDGRMPVDSAGKYCVVAAGLTEGLLTIASGMAHRSTDVVVFGGMGDVFEGFGHYSCCGFLTLKEKQVLLQSLIVSKSP